MQLDLIPYEDMAFHEFVGIVREIRTHYWHIRNLRKATVCQGRLRKEYRRVAVLKNKLLLAGHEKRTVLDLMACCRSKCVATKHPFSYCPYCGQGRKDLS